jgi:hypothetical protein
MDSINSTWVNTKVELATTMDTGNLAASLKVDLDTNKSWGRTKVTLLPITMTIPNQTPINREDQVDTTKAVVVVTGDETTTTITTSTKTNTTLNTADTVVNHTAWVTMVIISTNVVVMALEAWVILMVCNKECMQVDSRMTTTRKARREGE